MSDDGCAAGCLTTLYTPGMVLAMIISWEANHSILWALLHGWCSWAYVAYYVIYIRL